MKTKELAKLNREELTSKATELRNKVHDLKIQKTMGGEMNTALIRTSKRELARVLTVMNIQPTTAPKTKSKAKAKGRVSP